MDREIARMERDMDGNVTRTEERASRRDRSARVEERLVTLEGRNARGDRVVRVKGHVTGLDRPASNLLVRRWEEGMGYGERRNDEERRGGAGVDWEVRQMEAS